MSNINNMFNHLNKNKFRKDIDELLDLYDQLQETVSNLSKENEYLKSKNYKDEEIKRLQDEIYKLQEQLYYGFGITLEDHNKIYNWKSEHSKKHCGEQFEYVFCPTAIGDIGMVRCSCGEEFVFQDLK